MKTILSVLFISMASIISTAQVTAVGIWKNIDDEDGKEKSHIEVYEVDGKLHGKIKSLLDADPTTLCTECKGDKKDQLIVGMEIMWNLKQDGDKMEWKGGKIMDPKNGKEYKCKIKLAEEDILEVRGYKGFSLLGRTQKWYRVKSK